MSETKPTNASEIARLEQLIKDIPQLSTADQSLLTGALETYRGLLVLGKAFKFAVFALAGISALAVGSNHIKAALKSWLT